MAGHKKMQKILTEWRLYIQETSKNLPSFTGSSGAVEIIKKFEGFRSKPYLDSRGIPTIGWGTTVYPDGTKVTLRDKEITKKQAEIYLSYSLGNIIAGINKFMATNKKIYKKGPNKGNPIVLNQNQIDALASLGYNIGRRALLNSKVYTLATIDPDNPKIRGLFMQWQSQPGHQKRREAEAKLYFTPIA